MQESPENVTFTNDVEHNLNLVLEILGLWTENVGHDGVFKIGFVFLF